MKIWKKALIFIFVLFITFSLTGCEVNNNYDIWGNFIGTYFAKCDEVYFSNIELIEFAPEMHRCYYDGFKYVDEVVPCTIVGEEFDKTKLGKQTITIKTDEGEEFEFETNVIEFKLEDGIYCDDVFEATVLYPKFKAINNKIYGYDYETKKFSNEEFKICPCSVYIEGEESYDYVTVAEYTKTGDTVYSIGFSNEAKDNWTEFTFSIENNEIKLVATKKYEQNDIIFFTSLSNTKDICYDWFCIPKTGNYLTKDQLDEISLYGLITFDKEKTQPVTTETEITTNMLYISFEQEDYTGMPFLGKYYVEGGIFGEKLDMTIKANKITFPGELKSYDYIARCINGVWYISINFKILRFDEETNSLICYEGTEFEYYIKLKK